MDEKRKIKERLKKSLEEIAARQNGVQEAMRLLDPAGNLSFEELGTESEFDEVLERLGDRTGRELLEIAAAFRRLEEGTYDTCEECGGRISPERLEALPYTRHCVDCAVKLERL